MPFGHEEAERAAELLRADPDFRVLRRIAFGEAPVVLEAGVGQRTHVGAALDVETTGLDVRRDRIIELAVRRFRYDDRGRIVRLGRMMAWREDPGVPIPADVSALTGIFDADVAGCEIDGVTVSELLRSCQAVISHNASFDRPFVERRLPEVAGLDWGCTVSDLDWRARGFEGRALGWLSAQCGRFYDAHRAAGDVDALVALLGHTFDDGTTVLSAVLEGMSRMGWKVSAQGAGYAARDALKARRYRWDAARSEWWREVADAELESERQWLADAVYAPGLGARHQGPRIEAISSGNRHGLLQ